MADLDAATLEDVKNWFRSKYGPNNAVLVLAGDVSAAEARPLVEKYFGDIPRGPVNNPAKAAVPTLPAPKVEVMKDRVANTRLYRNWVVPGLLDDAAVQLDVAGRRARRPRQLAPRQRAGPQGPDGGRRYAPASCPSTGSASSRSRST